MPRNTASTPTAARNQHCYQAQLVIATAAALQWPAGYPQDVKIDARNLDNQDPEIFAWFITANFGTYLMLTPAMLDITRGIVCPNNRRGKLFLYQRRQLRPADWDTARAALVAVPKQQRKPVHEYIY